jgi:hypothetical protein
MLKAILWVIWRRLFKEHPHCEILEQRLGERCLQAPLTKLHLSRLANKEAEAVNKRSKTD